MFYELVVSIYLFLSMLLTVFCLLSCIKQIEGHFVNITLHHIYTYGHLYVIMLSTF